MANQPKFDLEAWFNSVDLDAIVLPPDKLDECRYFMSLLEREVDANRFRWLISAFFGAAYSYFEVLALHFHESFSHPDTGDSVPDEEALALLRQYVTVVQNPKNPFFVKTAGLHPVTKRLYEFRKSNTHHRPLSIMKVTNDLPAGFHLGHHKGKGEPALVFCRQVMDLIEDAQRRLEPHII